MFCCNFKHVVAASQVKNHIEAIRYVGWFINVIRPTCQLLPISPLILLICMLEHIGSLIHSHTAAE
jgi:hypothetical protein